MSGLHYTHDIVIHTLAFLNHIEFFLQVPLASHSHFSNIVEAAMFVGSGRNMSGLHYTHDIVIHTLAFLDHIEFFPQVPLASHSHLTNIVEDVPTFFVRQAQPTNERMLKQKLDFQVGQR